ncbi:hypothetical protein HJFPF1_00957 [Paramyrothecium foliicola]|nr:hypothetical protein HJFPF1_00957 [Paramyrothecium foliicola]
MVQTCGQSRQGNGDIAGVDASPYFYRDDTLDETVSSARETGSIPAAHEDSNEDSLYSAITGYTDDGTCDKIQRRPEDITTFLPLGRIQHIPVDAERFRVRMKPLVTCMTHWAGEQDFRTVFAGSIHNRFIRRKLTSVKQPHKNDVDRIIQLPVHGKISGTENALLMTNLAIRIGTTTTQQCAHPFLTMIMKFSLIQSNVIFIFFVAPASPASSEVRLPYLINISRPFVTPPASSQFRSTVTSVQPTSTGSNPRGLSRTPDDLTAVEKEQVEKLVAKEGDTAEKKGLRQRRGLFSQPRAFLEGLPKDGSASVSVVVSVLWGKSLPIPLEGSRRLDDYWGLGDITLLPGYDSSPAKLAARHTLRYPRDAPRGRVNKQLLQWIMRKYVAFWQGSTRRESGIPIAPDLNNVLSQFVALELVSNLANPIQTEWNTIEEGLARVLVASRAGRLSR